MNGGGDPSLGSLRTEGELARIDLVRRYLPAPLIERIPAEDLPWRGRAILALWVLGCPLPMAWILGMGTDHPWVAELRDGVGRLDDARLVADLEATAAARGDGRAVEFGTFGDGTRLGSATPAIS
jgi:hypothetical protein